MKKTITLGVLFWSLAVLSGAAVLQDWSSLDQDKNCGVFTDKDGSAIQFAQTIGPQAGEKAVKLTNNIKGWAGIWAAVESDISKTGAIQFKAKSSEPMLLQVGLNDESKTQYIAMVRILSVDWTEFTVPLSLFKPTPWPMADAPKDAKLNLAKIVGVVLQPQLHGVSTVEVGPISTVKGKVTAKIGMPVADPKRILVQDFTLLEKNAYGPFTDETTGSSIEMSLENDQEGQGNKLGVFHYDLKTDGYCGYWIRAGQEWGGQDWRGAKTLTVDVYSDAPVELKFGFNDANQSAYSCDLPCTKAGVWEKVSVPFSALKLNKYYQPPEAKKGAALDLSHIETFNLGPETHGKNVFKVREVVIEK